MGDTEKDALRMAAGVAVVTVAVNKMVSAYNQFTQKNLAVFAHFEQMQLGLTAMTGSAEKGKALFEELRTFSNKTTFGVDTLANATTQLLALGIAEDKVKDKLTQLGNIAGGSTEKFNRLVDVFVKIGAVGKASSIQLNQLSMITGISWRKIMADMGVAKPTFEDISKAFEKLTEEGGKFHGRMDAIIDTIEGKEGFIRDTADELRALFADITGQAERYKARLDLVYDIQYSVLQIFKDISNNEAAKNLISGVYTTALVALGGAITGLAAHFAVLVFKLKQVKAVLLLLKAAVPEVLIFSGLALAIYSVGKRIAEVTEDTREFKRALKELEEQIKDLGELKGNEGLGEKGKYWSERADIYDSAIKKIQARILELNALNKDNNRSLEVERLQKILEAYEYEAYLAHNTAEAYKKLSDAEKERLETQKSMGLELENNLSLINKVYGMSDEGKKALRIEELQKEAAALQSLLDKSGTTQYDKEGNPFKFVLDAVQSDRIKIGLEWINKEIDNILNPKKKPTLADNIISEIETIEQSIQRLFASTKEGQIATLKKQIADTEKYLAMAEDFNDDGEAKNMAETVLSMLYESLADLTKKPEAAAMGEKFVAGNDLLKQMYGATKQGQLEELRQRMEYAKNELATAKAAGDAERENQAVVVMRELEKALEENVDSTLSLKDAYTGWISNLKESGGMGTVAGYAMDSVMSKSSEAGDFMQGFQQGGVWGGIINAVLGAFMDIAEDMEGFDMIMAPLHDLLKQLTPTIEVIVRVLGTMNKRINNSVEPFLDIINDLVTEMEPLLDAMSSTSHILGIVLRGIGMVVKVINTALMPVIKGLANVFDFLFGWLDDLFGDTSLEDEKKSEVETLKELNQQYKELMQTMRENEQYYIERKRQLESDTYTKNLLGVNDMILTPHGNFSTDPEDTILAMKHPERLGSGGGLSVVVNDYGGNNVDVHKNSLGELIINISKKVASDFASGKNGWDSAMAAQQLRVAGRRVNA